MKKNKILNLIFLFAAIAIFGNALAWSVSLSRTQREDRDKIRTDAVRPLAQALKNKLDKTDMEEMVLYLMRLQGIGE